MTDNDFKQCRFIQKYMRFLTFYDFVKDCVYLKKAFDGMDDDGKLFYMWYIYANIHMTEHYKNVCWDFLNGYASYGDLKYNERFYKVK